MPIPTRRLPSKRRLLAAALGLAAILIVCLFGLLSPRPAPCYTVTDLGVLPGDTRSSASAVNSAGVAVGFSQGTRRRACMFGNGKVISPGVFPGMSDSDPHGINSAGDVTGSASIPTGHHAFLCSGGKMRDLGSLSRFTDSEGTGINDQGEVVGTAATSPVQPGFPHEHAFFYSQGRMTDLGTPPGCSESQATSINTAGQIVGDGLPAPGGIDQPRPFFYDSRTMTMTMLPMPPLNRGGWAIHTNDIGQTIGTVWTPNNRYHVVLWAGGRMNDLGAAPGFASSIGSGLNNRGEAVGYSFEDSSTQAVKAFLRDHAGGDNPLRRYLDRDTEHAFVYRDGKMQDLNELIPRDSDWTLENARDINDRGQIVGQGFHHGQERGFLLTPIH